VASSDINGPVFFFQLCSLVTTPTLHLHCQERETHFILVLLWLLFLFFHAIVFSLPSISTKLLHRAAVTTHHYVVATLHNVYVLSSLFQFQFWICNFLSFWQNNFPNPCKVVETKIQIFPINALQRTNNLKSFYKRSQINFYQQSSKKYWWRRTGMCWWAALERR
jgi:hypothetical protein